MNNITPNKRYSCSSEYGTPVNDDSDNSLYYSFALSEEENVPNKENSSNSEWTVTDLSLGVARIPLRSKTPLLRKVLQQNFTPGNQIKERGSFDCSSPLCLTSIIAETTTSDREGVLNVNDIHDMESINENLQINSIEKAVEDERKNQNQGIEYPLIDDSASDVTDDLENELQNTIIENLPPATYKSHSNYNLSSDDHARGDTIDGIIAVGELKSTELRPIHQGSAPKVVMVSSPIVNTIDTKTVEDVLSQGIQLGQTKNATKITRQLEFRKTLGVLKPVTNKAIKSIAGKFQSFVYIMCFDILIRLMENK